MRFFEVRSYFLYVLRIRVDKLPKWPIWRDRVKEKGEFREGISEEKAVSSKHLGPMYRKIVSKTRITGEEVLLPHEVVQTGLDAHIPKPRKSRPKIESWLVAKNQHGRRFSSCAYVTCYECLRQRRKRSTHLCLLRKNAGSVDFLCWFFRTGHRSIFGRFFLAGDKTSLYGP